MDDCCWHPSIQTCLVTPWTLARVPAAGPCKHSLPPKATPLKLIVIAPTSEFADQFERWNVLGTDLSPIQPREVPPNLRFEVDDACYAWTHRANSFDYIHMRLMYGSVENWPRLYSEVFRHLKPGAWFEQMEIGVIPRSDDGTIPPNSAFDSWGALALKASDEFGKTLRTVDEMKDNIIRAGFVDVTEVRFKLPMGPWSMDKRVADMGEANRTAWLTGLEGFCLYLLTRILRWPKLSVDVYVAQMRAMLLDKSVHAYQDW